MDLRTLALSVAVLALLAEPGGPGGPSAATGVQRESIRGMPELPLPFLGSGGIAVQAPVTEPTAPLPLLRTRSNGQLPQPRLRSARSAAGRGAVLPRRERRASVRAGLLGTPPPQPRSGPAQRRVDSGQA